MGVVTLSVDSGRSSFQHDSDTILEEEKASKRRRSGVDRTRYGIGQQESDLSSIGREGYNEEK